MSTNEGLSTSIEERDDHISVAAEDNSYGLMDHEQVTNKSETESEMSAMKPATELSKVEDAELPGLPESDTVDDEEGGKAALMVDVSEAADSSTPIHLTKLGFAQEEAEVESLNVGPTGEKEHGEVSVKEHEEELDAGAAVHPDDTERESSVVSSRLGSDGDREGSVSRQSCDSSDDDLSYHLSEKASAQPGPDLYKLVDIDEDDQEDDLGMSDVFLSTAGTHLSADGNLCVDVEKNNNNNVQDWGKRPLSGIESSAAPTEMPLAEGAEILQPPCDEPPAVDDKTLQAGSSSASDARLQIISETSGMATALDKVKTSSKDSDLGNDVTHAAEVDNRAGSPGEGGVMSARRGSRKGSPSHTTQLINIREGEEENFVLSALFSATEEGNLSGLLELVDRAEHIDLNQCNRQGETVLHMAASGGHVDIISFLQTHGIDLNAKDKHGDTAVYWAARQGHMEVIKYLAEQGVSVNTQNKSGEAAIHVAARYGHANIIEYLCGAQADLNLQDKMGETALHTAAWHGLPTNICSLLCTAGCKVDIRNKEEESPLHCAASRGNMDCVRVLLAHGATLNLQDKRGSTALHLSCRRRYTGISLLLLHAGCQMDILDYINETPLFPSCKEGLLPVVQTLCAFGCQVDLLNKGGVSPLHMASRAGHTEVGRCLLLSGAEPDLPNKEGVTAEIMALAQGHNDIAEMLARLRPDRREQCIKQLIPTNQPLHRVKVKVFGSSGVGKTTLVESLKCGYFGSFFRKSRLTSSTSVTNTKQKGGTENGSTTRHNSLPSQLSYEVVHEGYTKGVDVQQVNLTGSGELSVWEFSGYEPYYMMYDHFIGDPNCIHIVVYNVEDTQDVQLSQLLFWLNFLKARMTPLEPIGMCGKVPWPARVVLVGTHADKVSCPKNHKGEYESEETSVLLQTVQQKFQADLNICDHIFVVDSHLAMSADLKALRMHVGEMKASIVQCLPFSSGFLDATVAALPIWRKALSNYPVVTWPSFIEYVRSKVNMLSSEEHLKELMCQLQLVGEVIYLETEMDEDLVILSPRWLCNDVLGQLLSHDNINHSRPTGCFTADDFQLMFAETDAKDLLVVLEALEVCTSCEVDGEVEYEFPCLNFVETLHGLWERDDRNLPDPVYCGVRLQCPRGMTNQLLHLFPRVQVQLRRDVLQEREGVDVDLYQWYHGSKFCNRSMEALISLETSDQAIEIKCRGPVEMRTSLYYFMDDMCDIVLDVLEDGCPGLCPEKHILSAAHLNSHERAVHLYTPKDILSVQLEGGSGVPLTHDQTEDLIDLIGFGSEEIWNNMTPGVDLHMSTLPLHARRRLSMLLDPPDPMGRDWCLLAVSLGLTEDLPRVDSDGGQTRSKTDSIMSMWAQSPEATVGALLRKLQELGRQDAIDTLLTVSPLYHLGRDDDDDNQGGGARQGKNNTHPASHSSENTVSSNLSR